MNKFWREMSSEEKEVMIDIFLGSLRSYLLSPDIEHISINVENERSKIPAVIDGKLIPLGEMFSGISHVKITVNRKR